MSTRPGAHGHIWAGAQQQDTAEIYDDVPRGDESATVAFPEELAGGGPALELAIGRGRIALPLAARVSASMVSTFSPAMVAKLREKPRGDQLSHDGQLR